MFFLPKEYFSALGSVPIHPAFTRTFLQPVSIILNSALVSQCFSSPSHVTSAENSTLIVCPTEATNDSNDGKQNNPFKLPFHWNDGPVITAVWHNSISFAQTPHWFHWRHTSLGFFMKPSQTLMSKTLLEVELFGLLCASPNCTTCYQFWKDIFKSLKVT